MALDPYKVLGVDRSASEAEIKKAHRRKAKDLHPDQNPDDPKKLEAFKQVSQAWDILGDKEKRAKFDRGEIDGDGNPTGFGGGYPGGGPGGGGQRWETRGGGNPFGGAQGDPFEDILSGMFGGGGRSRRSGPVKGRDVRYRVTIDFADSVTGARRRMTMADNTALDVNIPAGIESGQTLRLKSQGQASPNGGPPGDALLEVEVKPSSVWERDGKDLRMSVPIDLKIAVLGGSVEVKTPSGPVTLKVPAGSNTGSQLRLRGKGVQTSTPGNLYARLEIVLDDPKDDGLKAWAEGR
ncbi:DnaJ C-terminal domain-containing protein [Hyphomonas sp. L-53-1-40]|uniref:DnaJ C-terminal domain-containing protein n=1 Tax=Hyphomonas sp. L-53-1-40 TaxID=1207058 RepID=UPI000558871A|nr:J domain-containing protein [Hyphomonas sp. L-53-1-40]